MTIPAIKSLPTKKILLPLAKMEAKLRPFLVKEEKILIMAREEKENPTKAYLDAVEQIVDACTFGTVKVKELNQADLEYIFLQIRIMSKGESSSFEYKCLAKNEEGQECGTQIPVTIQLDQVELKTPDEHQTLFQIPHNDVYIQMKYPSIQLASEFESKNLDIQNVDDMKWEHIETLIAANIDSIIVGTKDESVVYNKFTREELVAWFEQVPSDTLKDIIEKFFNLMPYLAYDLEVECPACGTKHEQEIRGLDNFFD